MWARCIAGLLVSVTPLLAVKVGDSRDEVIAELGEPKNRLVSARREILNYPAGTVMLIDGRVNQLSGNFNQPEGAPPQANPSAKTASAPSVVQCPSTAQWLTSLPTAQTTAKQEGKLILALFTGSDWCPPCQSFEAEVAHDEQFAGIFSRSFVFYKNDWLRNTPQPPRAQRESREVRQKYKIISYPTLKILNAEGEELDTVNWTSVEGGGTLKEIMIEAIDNSRKVTQGGMKAK